MTPRPSTLNPQPSVCLHIERLVLYGLPVERGQGPTFQAVLESELTRLITEEGVPPSLSHGGAMARIEGGTIPTTQEFKTRTLATQIARAVYGGLST